MQVTQSQGGSTDCWQLFLQRLPKDQPHDSLMSHATLSSTIVRLYNMRVCEMAAAAEPMQVLANDSVFDTMAAYFNHQFAGDGVLVFMPEVQDVDGPIARVLMSCRCATECEIACERHRMRTRRHSLQMGSSS
jgi:hypothetical protein